MFKNFGKIIFVLFFGFLLLGAPNTGLATISLEFNPMNQSVNLGDPASVGIWVTDPGQTLVGAFDFWVRYDASIITLNSVAWGTSLGTLVPGVDADYSVENSIIPGSLDVVNLWAEWDGSGTPNQDPNGFSLLTMNFDTVGVGTSALWITDALESNPNELDIFGDLPREYFLSDNNFEYIPIANNIEPGTIKVTTTTSVPEPGTALLLGLGLAALASLKKRTS